MAKRLYLDQLSKFHVKDPERLKPGTKLLFGHVPPLQDPELRDSKVRPFSEQVTVDHVGNYSFEDLHENVKEFPSSKEKSPVVILDKGLSHYTRYRYLGDAGVLPYNGSFYNSSNFTVILDDLKEAGVELVLEVSPEYRARMEEFNEQVVEWDYDH